MRCKKYKEKPSKTRSMVVTKNVTGKSILSLISRHHDFPIRYPMEGGVGLGGARMVNLLIPTGLHSAQRLQNPTTFFSHNQTPGNPQGKTNENPTNQHNPFTKGSPSGKTKRIKPNDLFLSQSNSRKPSKKVRMKIYQTNTTLLQKGPRPGKQKEQNPTTFFSHNQTPGNPPRKENENPTNQHNPFTKGSPSGKKNKTQPFSKNL